MKQCIVVAVYPREMRIVHVSARAMLGFNTRGGDPPYQSPLAPTNTTVSTMRPQSKDKSKERGEGRGEGGEGRGKGEGLTGV